MVGSGRVGGLRMGVEGGKEEGASGSLTCGLGAGLCSGAPVRGPEAGGL